MNDTIEPALNAEGWETLTPLSGVDWRAIGQQFGVLGSPPTLIALANAALPDSDPRKITRAAVEVIRKFAYWHHHAAVPAMPERYQYLARAEISYALLLADALASYLPPEDP